MVVEHLRGIHQETRDQKLLSATRATGSPVNILAGRVSRRYLKLAKLERQARELRLRPPPRSHGLLRRMADEAKTSAHTKHDGRRSAMKRSMG